MACPRTRIFCNNEPEDAEGEEADSRVYILKIIFNKNERNVLTFGGV